MNIHPITTPASPSLASQIFDASFDSIESLNTTFTSPVVPTLETTTVTEVALGYHRNQQYSITAMTTSTGAVAERYAYTAYGQPTILNASGSVLTSSAVGNRYTYTGREWDETLGLHHFRARWMSPLAGRFLGRDPVGYEPGTWNVNEFVNGNPHSLMDPTGMIPIVCTCETITERGSIGQHNVTVECGGLASNCCRNSCGPGSRWTGEWHVVNARPDNLDLDNTCPGNWQDSTNALDCVGCCLKDVDPNATIFGWTSCYAGLRYPKPTINGVLPFTGGARPWRFHMKVNATSHCHTRFLTDCGVRRGITKCLNRVCVATLLIEGAVDWGRIAYCLNACKYKEVYQ
jgi:RHS repeat-associated protein